MITKKQEVKNIKFIVRTDTYDEESNTYGVLQVRNVGDDNNISELEVTPDEIEQLINLLEETKELINKTKADQQ